MQVKEADKSFMQNLQDELERICPSDLATALFRDRPYDGQPQTDTGERGKTFVSNVTFRDLRDCFVIGCFEASGLSPNEYPKSLYDLPWKDMDPIAVFQNMSCAVEKRMGIFPNVPGLKEVSGHAEQGP